MQFLINATGHAVVMFPPEYPNRVPTSERKHFVRSGGAKVIPQGSITIRIDERTGHSVPMECLLEDLGTINLRRVDSQAVGVKVYKDDGGQTTLPPVKEGVFYLVSNTVAANLGREDMMMPTDAVLDVRGRIVGCRAISRRLRLR